MLLKENYLRQLIRKNILLSEAVYKIAQLKKDFTIEDQDQSLYEIASDIFENAETSSGMNFSFENPKSVPRLFIDPIYECLDEIKKDVDSGATNIEKALNKVKLMCVYIIKLGDYINRDKSIKFYVKEDPIPIKDIVSKFISSRKKFKFETSAPTALDKLKYLYENIKKSFFEEHSYSEPSEVYDEIKEHETEYPFGIELVDDKFLVVLPESRRSSVFWARTNWKAEDKVLIAEDEISWCTSKQVGVNLFNKYYQEESLNLYYFLPKDDLKGTKKFCIGLNKEKKSVTDDAKILTGGYQLVGFENKKFVEDNSDFNDPRVRQAIIQKFGVSNQILDKLAKHMQTKGTFVREEYYKNFKKDDLTRLFDLDKYAPIQNKTGSRPLDLLKLLSQDINSFLTTYQSTQFKEAGHYKPELMQYFYENWPTLFSNGVRTDLDSDIFKKKICKIDEPLFTNQYFGKFAQDKYLLKHLPDNLADNTDFMINAIKMDGGSFEGASARLRNDKDVALFAIKQNASSINYIGDELKNDISFFQTIYSQPEFRRCWSYALGSAGPNVLKDVDIISTGLASNINQADYLPKEMLANRELAIKVINKQLPFSRSIFEKLDESLRNDSELALQVIAKGDIEAFHFIGPKLSDNFEFFKEIFSDEKYLKAREYALFVASDRIKSYKPFAIIACKANPAQFKVLPDTLKEDIDLVFMSIDENMKSSDNALMSIGENLKNNFEFFKKIFSNEKYSHLYDHAIFAGNDKVKAYKPFAKLGVQANPEQFAVLSDELRNDPEIVEIIINNKSHDYTAEALSQMGEDVKNDVNLNEKMVKNNYKNYKYIGDRAKRSGNLLLRATRKDVRMLKYGWDHWLDNDDFMHTILNENGDALEYASKRIKDNPEYVKMAVNNKMDAFQYASERLRNDPAIAIFAASKRWSDIYYIGKTLYNSVSFAVSVLKAGIKPENQRVPFSSEVMSNYQVIAGLSILDTDNLLIKYDYLTKIKDPKQVYLIKSSQAAFRKHFEQKKQDSSKKSSVSEQTLRRLIRKKLIESITTNKKSKPYGKGNVNDMLLDREGWVTDPNDRKKIKKWYLDMGLAYN